MTLLNLILRATAMLFPWVLAQSMVFTHTQTRSVRTDGGRSSPSNSTIPLTGDSEDNRAPTLAADLTQVFPCAWLAAGLRSFYLHSTVACTITIYDDSNTLVGTVALPANVPFQWAYGDPGSPPISGDAVTFNASTVATGTLTIFVLQNSGLVATAALTGTITAATESQIVTGGRTIILTLTGATWAAAGAAFNAQRQPIADGIVSAQAEAAGWNAQVSPTFVVSNVVRTSSTIVTITTPATAGYSVTANEILTATIPAAATSISSPIVAAPTATITANS